MSALKIDSSTIDPLQLGAYQLIDRVTGEHDIPYLIVGASARDLVMHHHYGAQIARATQDIDLAIQVPDWNAFNTLRSSLVTEGYRETVVQHRLLNDQDIPLDIIPFGPLETENAEIAWPPNGAIRMGVLGFEEALDHADQIHIGPEPHLELPVVSPIGLVLLKLVAWSERDQQNRRKDAQDILYVLRHFEDIPAIEQQLYGKDVGLLERYEWDTRVAGSHVLGIQLKQITWDRSARFLKQLLTEDSLEAIAQDAGHISLKGNLALLKAMADGFQS